MKIYCSGIGGIGLSAYASLQQVEGNNVMGSDRSHSVITHDLEQSGITVTTDQSGAAIPTDTDLFVYSEAIAPDAPERLRANALHIPQKSYPEALGEYLARKKVIAICGTHGKSSTTAMAIKALVDCGLDPSAVVGTRVRELGGRNWRKGKGEWFVLEACEYRRSFMHYSPTITILTNCDGDHFDYYSSMEEYKKAFTDFLRRLPANGQVITHLGDPNCVEVTSRLTVNVIDADTYPLVRLATPGLHMQKNAQLVLALTSILSLDTAQVQQSLGTYAGSWRRMEIKGEARGTLVIDDYAHHPTEIRATIEGIRSAYPERRLVCVFQPHTHDRTIKLYDDFTHSFSGADIVIIPNIYVARSNIEHGSVSVDTFVRDIQRHSSVHAINGESLKRTEEFLRKEILKPGDVLLCMGAGDITSLTERMLR